MSCLCKSVDWLYFKGLTCTTFASGMLKLRNFQAEIQRKMAVDVYNSVYILARHKYALSYGKGVPCVYIHIYPRWRRCVLFASCP